ncbi:Pimeloyl-ACP methyl ester carboxylesterase [Tistlia consotensis]|uniref:Pimeloyl-ACP methyl ester carboxylesterase n=1 Tax=Tistlia consotensis USBA 355 TaxID=560819 RepID=A0A1Y6CHF2_9PROT|nr:alpha/beta hydrolase [Tistlia consotensis]SMF65557.1 Pimeloyl-ACP methyl ester carboxylesterase [Tistlia consotensis USBA 355]SNS03572.1 Pimeloyl-ACP methyl ester carboxylesterase [Tistlia consotensis]
MPVRSLDSRLDGWLERCAADPELATLSQGLEATLAFQAGAVERRLTLGEAPRLGGGTPVLLIRAEAAAWQQLLSGPYPRGWQSFGAIRRFNPAFEITVESPLTEAQLLAPLERLVEIAVAPPAEPNLPAGFDLSGLESGLKAVGVDARGPAQIRVTTAGSGRPVLFLHTAGADSRQWLYQLGDPALAARYRMVAFDLPGHGGSGLEGEFGGRASAWQATGGRYLAWCKAAIEAFCEAPPIVVGCSAGAAMALTLAAKAPDLVAAAIALEAPFKARGRLTPFLDHARVHAGRHNPAWVRALLAPGSPKPHRDEACGIYQQARPGTYAEDLRYYSEEFDAAELVEALNRNGRPVVLRTGAYDYSASPEDSGRIAEAVPAADFEVMPELGHFPMIENPGAFAPWLAKALEAAEERS